MICVLPFEVKLKGPETTPRDCTKNTENQYQAGTKVLVGGL
jgi:hypothetical protein